MSIINLVSIYKEDIPDYLVESRLYREMEKEFENNMCISLPPEYFRDCGKMFIDSKSDFIQRIKILIYWGADKIPYSIVDYLYRNLKNRCHHGLYNFLNWDDIYTNRIRDYQFIKDLKYFSKYVENDGYYIWSWSIINKTVIDAINDNCYEFFRHIMTYNFDDNCCYKDWSKFLDKIIKEDRFNFFVILMENTTKKTRAVIEALLILSKKSIQFGERYINCILKIDKMGLRYSPQKYIMDWSVYNLSYNWIEYSINRFGNIGHAFMMNQSNRTTHDGVLYTSFVCARGDFKCLQLLHSKGYECIDKTLEYAAIGGNMDCFKYLIKHNCPRTDAVCNKIVEGKNPTIEFLEYAMSVGFEINPSVCFSATKRGRLDILKFAHSKNPDFKFDINYRTLAGRRLYIDCLEYILEHLVDGDAESTEHIDEIINKAKIKPTIPALKFLKKHGWKCDLTYAEIYKMITKDSKVDVFEYFHDNFNVSFGDGLLNRAANVGNYDIIVFLHKTCGCELTMQTSIDAAKGGNVKCLRYLHNNGCPWGYKTSSVCTNNECLIYLCENNCPMHNNTLRIVNKIYSKKSKKTDNKKEGCTVM